MITSEGFWLLETTDASEDHHKHVGDERFCSNQEAAKL